MAEKKRSSVKVKDIKGDIESGARESAKASKPSAKHFQLAAYRVIQEQDFGGGGAMGFSFRKSANPKKLEQIKLSQALPVQDESVSERQRTSNPAKDFRRAPPAESNANAKPKLLARPKGSEVDVDDYVSGAEEEPSEHPSEQKPTGPQYWIDVEIPGHSRGTDLESMMPHLLELVIKPCLLSIEHDPDLGFLKQHVSDWHQWQTPQSLPLPNAALTVMRILQADDDDDDDTYVVRHAGALCLPNRLITVGSSATSVINDHAADGKKNSKPKTLSALDDTLQEVLIQKSQQLLEESISGCLLLWLSFHTTRTTAAVHKLRENIYELFDVMTHNIEDLSDKDVAACKDRLLRISAVAEEQAECIQALVEGGDAVCDAICFDENPTLTGALNVIKQGAASTERHVLRLEKRIADLEQALDAFQQKKINGRLNILTVFSAIFLPLTLMSGLYGMNFSNMPELETNYGYFVLLGAMVTVASSLLFFFWRAGWCKNE